MPSAHYIRLAADVGGSIWVAGFLPNIYLSRLGLEFALPICLKRCNICSGYKKSLLIHIKMVVWCSEKTENKINYVGTFSTLDLNLQSIKIVFMQQSGCINLHTLLRLCESCVQNEPITSSCWTVIKWHQSSVRLFRLRPNEDKLHPGFIRMLKPLYTKSLPSKYIKAFNQRGVLKIFQNFLDVPLKHHECHDQQEE